MSHEFFDFCDSSGIRRQFTAPYIPRQNGVAERRNRTVVEMARSMLRSKGLLKFWAEVVSTTIYLLNISPTKAVKNITPTEAWMGVKPLVKHLRIFGCIAYTLIPSQRLQTFDAMSENAF